MKSITQLKLNTSILVSILLAVGINGQVCEVKDTCKCVFEDGSGYDLSQVLETKETIEIAPTLDTRIFFSPCKNSVAFGSYNITVNDCKAGYTLCFLDVSIGHAHLLGNTANTTFMIDNDEIAMKFGSANVSTVELQCTPNAKDSILYAPSSTKEGDVKLTLFSKFSCRTQVTVIESHGFFYTFFLISFIVLFTYLIVGILYNYFFVGARGFELLPNYDFWTRLWTSVKLGFMFVKNGFRVLPTEDSYDAI